MRASACLGDLGGLSGRRRLVPLDPRGTGGSAVPADPATYRVDRQVADVEALREHLGLDRVDVLAHSAGGYLALLHVARHPRRIRSLALIAARARALGVDFTEEHHREAVALRARGNRGSRPRTGPTKPSGRRGHRRRLGRRRPVLLRPLGRRRSGTRRGRRRTERLRGRRPLCGARSLRP
ncbi:alpha/beta fold hydrolase, partial [Streptomyces sp. Wh19]|uniref:alpha/beta fold hydrolase n=1 Tax=Streptomyces sp. Wh19 TaxID=3076629 RepID=UPI003FA349A4